MVSQSVIPSKKHLGGAKPFMFTEQGVANLSSVLTSPIAIEMNIKIIRAFVAVRKLFIQNIAMFERFERIEQRLSIYDDNFNKLFDAIESKELKPKQGIFYEGQIFDAYAFVSELIKSAKKSIILIDDEIYHIGASLKDLGKKWFGFSKMHKESFEIIGRIN